MSKIKYILVDDERLARAEMKLMLERFTDFVLVGEAGNAMDAEKLVVDLQPDLIFLDIQMPEISGFELISRLNSNPDVIFVTAFDQYAVEAFELNAVDYLLKPVREERLEKTIGKIKSRHDDHRKNQHLFIKEGENIHFIKIASIYLIESIGNYARIYFGDKKVFFKRSLNQMEKMLDPALFFRINRSEIVNITLAEKIGQLQDGRLTLHLPNNEVYTASNRQSAVFKSRKMV